MYCIIDTIQSQILGKLCVAKKPQKSPKNGAIFCNTKVVLLEAEANA